MTKIKGLYDSTGKVAFLGCENYVSLLPKIASIKPDYGFFDHMVLWLQRFGRGAPYGELPHFPLYTLERCFSFGFKGALFFDSSRFMDASYVGLIETDHVQTIKIFAKPDDVIFATHQARFVQEHFSGPFVILPVTLQQENLLAAPFIRRKRAIARNDYIEEKLLHLADIFAQNTTIYKDIHDMIPIDFYALCINAGYVDLSALVRQWPALRSHAQVPIVPIHGHMTQWNLFINDDDKIVLTDYDRAGWHIPYYDYYHYILHEASGKKNAPKLSSFKFQTGHVQSNEFLRLYLIDQIYQDISSLVYKKHDHKKLHYQIANKSAWLKEALNQDG